MRKMCNPSRIIVIILSVVCLLAFNSSMFATIILTDDPVFGTNSIIRDLDNNMDYLQLDFTTPYSYNGVLAELGAGGYFEGWRVASFNDMTLLGISANIVHGSTDTAMLARAEELRDWFCDSCVNLSSTHEYARGLLSDVNIHVADTQEAFSIGRRFNIFPEEVDFRISGYGLLNDIGEETFLVRATVPEPTSLLLLGTGLGALGLVAYRRKRK